MFIRSSCSEISFLWSTISLEGSGEKERKERRGRRRKNRILVKKAPARAYDVLNRFRYKGITETTHGAFIGHGEEDGKKQEEEEEENKKKGSGGNGREEEGKRVRRKGGGRGGLEGGGGGGENKD